MFLQELIFKTMKHVLICLLVVFTVFSCTKDAVHNILEKYTVIDGEIIVTRSGNNVKFSANLDNYGNDEIIDHGFIWGTKIIDPWYEKQEDLQAWLNDFSDEKFKKFLLENGTVTSLGKLENSREFTNEQVAVLGQKSLVMAYIKTSKYVLYSKVSVFENEASVAWSKKPLLFQIPDDGQYFSVNDDVYIFYDYNKIGKLNNSDYQLIQKRQCPVSLKTLHFVIGENVYFSTGNHAMWKYSTTTDIWTMISDAPSILAYEFSPISFSKDQKGYNHTYDYQGNNFIYEFDPITNIWTKKNKSDIPFYSVVFQYKNQIYALSDKELWYYDENLATFINKTNIDINFAYSILTINDKIYIVSLSQNGSTYDIYTYDIYTYNMDSNETEKFCSIPNYFISIPFFTASNNKIFFLPPWQSYLYELDISKLK